MSIGPIQSGASMGSFGTLSSRLPNSEAMSDKLTSLGERLQGEQTKDTTGSEEDPTRDAFRDFVGQTFFGQLIASMRSTQNEPAYFHGGQAEKIFQGQFDQQLAETLSDKSAAKVADPMYELFSLKQR